VRLQSRTAQEAQLGGNNSYLSSKTGQLSDCSGLWDFADVLRAPGILKVIKKEQEPQNMPWLCCQ